MTAQANDTAGPPGVPARNYQLAVVVCELAVAQSAVAAAGTAAQRILPLGGLEPGDIAELLRAVDGLESQVRGAFELASRLVLNR